MIGDGHDLLSASVQWQGPGETGWQETRMRLLGNDRWSATFPLTLRGLHRFRVVAWRDHYATYRHELGAKSAASVPIALELVEGRSLLRAAVDRKSPRRRGDRSDPCRDRNDGRGRPARRPALRRARAPDG